MAGATSQNGDLSDPQSPEAGRESDPRGLVLPPGGHGRDDQCPSALPISSHSFALPAAHSETPPGSQPFVKGTVVLKIPIGGSPQSLSKMCNLQSVQVQGSHIQGISSQMGQAVMSGVLIHSCMCLFVHSSIHLIIHLCIQPIVPEHLLHDERWGDAVSTNSQTPTELGCGRHGRW